MGPGLEPWSAVAPNLPEHADNPIHTDAGAQAAGYPAAVVAGTTVYALMTHPPASAWGDDWIARGGCEVRFKAPVLADDLVTCRVAEADHGCWTVDAVARNDVAASCRVWPDATVPDRRDGDRLPPLEVTLDETWAGYGARSGDDLATYAERGIVHPAAWPSLANRVFRLHLVDGAWIHTRSHIVHVAAVERDARVTVDSRVIDRFETRSGRRAVVDCRIRAGDDLVCVIEHEALVELY